MQKNLIVFLSWLLIISIFSSLSLAENTLNFMEKLYNDLAEIIEDWINNPSRCLVQVEYYCKLNRKEFAKYFEDEGGCRECAAGQFERVSKQLAKSKVPKRQTKIYQAISRYNQAML